MLVRTRLYDDNDDGCGHLIHSLSFVSAPEVLKTSGAGYDKEVG